jgi:hypothetical protein
MPVKDGFGLDDNECFLPVRPGSRQKQPEESIRLPKSRTPVASIENRKLLSEDKDFKAEAVTGAEEGAQEAEK